MNNPECFSCDKRQLCEPIIASTVIDSINKSIRNDDNNVDIDPMDLLSSARVLSEVVDSGDISKIEQVSDKIDIEQLNHDEAIFYDGYSRLKEMGCSLTLEEYAVRIAQYVKSNMFTIMLSAAEELMVHELSQEVDTMGIEEERSTKALDEAGIEIANIREEIDEVISGDSELGDMLRSTISDLDNMQKEIRIVTGESLDTSGMERPKRSTIEERKELARQKFIHAQGWDSNNLDLGQKLEIKAHLRGLGLIR